MPDPATSLLRLARRSIARPRRTPRLPSLSGGAGLALLLLVFGSLMAAPAALSQQEAAGDRGFSVQDLVTLKRISDPRVSPDGRRVVFVLRETDLEADRGRTDLWMVGTDGADLRRLTTDPASDWNPRWAPDGSGIYFLSSRSGSSQVWRLPAAGGEARQVTDLPLDAGNLVVSPAGDALALTLEVFPDCEDLQCTVERLESEEESPATGRLYERLLFRHWDRWDDGRRSHLFSVPLEAEEGSEGGGGDRAGEPVHLTAGLDADVPSQPFGGPEEIAFSPDGSELVFSSRDAGREEAWSTDFDLFRVPVDGSAPPENLTEANPAWDTLPVFSPDGRRLAYLAMSRAGYEADRFRILLRDLETGAERELARDWDRSPSSLVFSPDGAGLFVTAANVGQVSLFRVDLAGGGVETVWWDGHVRSPAIVPAGGAGEGDSGHRILFGLDTLGSPVDLYTVAPDGSDLRRLTEINAEALDEVAMGEYEQFYFEGWNGERVWGYVVQPAGFDPEQTYPVAFLIHGGPQGSFGNDFHYRWNPQTYAGAGFAAVMVDFHGSVGYGQEFTDSIRGDWGGKPLVDLQKGLAAAVERFPWLDGERVCALGASYGGYMINWIAGNWPDRFRCLVNHDGIFDNRMMYYATEELWFPEWEHGGPYHAAPEGFERHNPALHVERWRTPMLVVHGALDFRVPETQGFATFTALQRRGVPSELLYFPDENHWVLKPANSVLWHETVNGWLDRWLRPDVGGGGEEGSNGD